MKIYYSSITGIDPSKSLYPALSSASGSALGASLLAAAYADYTKGGLLPKILRLPSGKPIFQNTPDLHFSISHSRTHVLCALSANPVGADTLDHRKMRAETVSRLATEEELSYFTFHQLWTLRESFFKLTGDGDLRTIRIVRKDGKIKCPREDVFLKLYHIGNASAGAASYTNIFPSELIEIPAERLLKKGRLS